MEKNKMGLDMYLYKTKKVDGFTAKDYSTANTILDYYHEKELAEHNKVEFNYTFKEWVGDSTDMTLEEAKVLESEFKNVGTHFEWFSIFTEVGYWRKANHIHAWFVENVQGGNDDCSYYTVTEDNLMDLKEICEKVVALNPYSIDEDSQFFYSDASLLTTIGAISPADYILLEAKLEQILPTESGFFFGSTDYSPYYFKETQDTIDIIEKILKEADFEKEVYLYVSSW